MRIAVDCEFSFDSDNEFYLVCAAVTQDDGVTRTWWRDEIDSLKSYIVSHRSDTWVAHNVETAEGYMFQSLGFRPTKFRWHDTLMMSRVVHNLCSERHLKHGLADCLAREHIKKLDADQKHEDQSICIWRQDCTWEAHLEKLEANKDHLMEYCLSDTAYLLRLDSILDKGMQRHLKHVLDKATLLEPYRRSDYFGFLSAIASEISWNGIPMSGERVTKLLNNAPTALAYKQMAFNKKYPGTYRLVKNQLHLVTSKCQEYAAFVYGDNPPRTATGNVSLASEYTKTHKDLDDFLGDYYNCQKACRALSSFSKKSRDKNWLGMFLRKRNIVRPRINLLGTQTGRCSSKPSTGFVYTMGKAFRGLVDPPEGYVIVELDYHSEEIGCQAYLSGDSTMATMYEGPDYYTTIAQSFEPDITDKHDHRRQKYKTVALMSNYGCGAKHLAEIAKISESEARTILKNMKKLFKKYWRYVGKCLDNCGEGSSMSFSDGFHIRNSGGKITSLGNWPFQGVGALILRKLLVELYKINVRIVAPVHDAIVFMCKESEWKDITDKVAQLMRDVSRECLGKEVDVGSPEVTFHGYVNCHSELCSREDYRKLYEEVKKYDEKVKAKIKVSDAEKYLHEYLTYMQRIANTKIIGDTANLYVDEEWVKNDE